MTSSPAIVVTLPGRSIPELRSETEIAVRAGADLVEVRVDRLPPAERTRLERLFPSPVPLLATLRSGEEGGESDPGDDRAKSMDTLATMPFAWIDLEVAQDDLNLIQRPRPPGGGYVLSSHRVRAPTASALATWLREVGPPGTVRKLVFPADLFALLALVPTFLERPEVGPVVVHSTGPSGPLLRAWSGRLGFAWAFAALPGARPAGGSSPTVEPSQLPVDELRTYLRSPTPAPLFAVLGHPIDHSLSPAIHHRWISDDDRSALYFGLDVLTPEELGGLLRLRDGLGFRGLSVTHPWKATALGLATRASATARLCDGANCLTISSGEVDGENTDFSAIRRRMQELTLSGSWDGSAVAVLGAGGAARATLAAAQDLKVDATVFARRPEAAEQLARVFGARVGPTSPGPLPLVVHATDVGRAGNVRLDLPLDRLLRADGYLLDWVYAAPDSPVSASARRAGCPYEDGTRLLVYQAAASYARWWGSPPNEGQVGEAIGALT